MTINASSILKKLLVLFLVFVGLHYGESFLMPLATGGVLATLFLPLCKWLEGKKVPKGLAALTCLLIVLLIIAGIGALLGWQISALTNDISLIKQRGIETVNRIQQYLLNHFGISAAEQSQLLKNEQPSLTGIVQVIAGSFFYIISNLVFILVYIFLLLYYRRHILQFFLKLSPPEQQAEMEQVLYSVSYVSQQYLLGLSKMIVCLWVMYGIGFSLLGVKNALFFAVLCGFMEIVPFIGNITGTTLTVLVSAVNGGSLPMLGGIVATYACVQFIQGWVLEPLILGPQVKINPFTTILALVLGELIWGIPGIFLAIPLIAMLKIVCDHIDSLKPYGFLIGSLESPKKDFTFFLKLKQWARRKNN